MSEKVFVSVDFIQQAYKAACSEWKEKIKKEVPEAFSEEPFEFGPEYSLGTHEYGEDPLFIANNYAPAGLKYKCLILKKGWEIKTEPCGHGTILTFVKI